MFTAMDKPATVYMAINKLNGKRYIGVTGRGVDRRAFEHVRDALKGIGRGAFAHAIRKYGADGFDWVTIRDFDTGREAVAEEKRLIRTACPDYNSTYGGEGYHPRVLSEDARRRISEANRGNTYCLGKTHTSETKEKLRSAGLRDKNKWLERSHLGPEASAKKVVCLNDGETFPSASAAARAYGLESSSVVDVCNRSQKRHIAGGLVFRYYGDHDGGHREAVAKKNRARDHSVSGLKGISPHYCGPNKWRAQIAVNKKKIHLGLFRTPEEAHAAYLKAEAELR